MLPQPADPHLKTCLSSLVRQVYRHQYRGVLYTVKLDHKMRPSITKETQTSMTQVTKQRLTEALVQINSGIYSLFWGYRREQKFTDKI